MITLTRYADCPFDDPAISVDELAAFATDHLERLSANNPGSVFTDRITETTTALSAFDDAHTGDLTALGQRKAQKLTKNNFRETLAFEVGKILGAVIAQYGDGTPEVVECVPQGRKVFSTCRDDEVENHLDVLVNGVSAHEADLGAALTTQAEDLRDDWLAIYAASEAATGAKTATEAEKRAARESLQWILYVNLQAITREYPRQPEMVTLYMQQHLLGMPADDSDPGNGGGGGGGDGPSDSSSSSSSSYFESSSSSYFDPSSSSSSSYPDMPPSSSSSADWSSSSSSAP